MLGVLARDMMGAGLSSGTAQALGGSVNSAVSAAGTTQSDSTELTASLNVVSTVAASSGVRVFNGPIGDSQVIYNSGANPLKVYPPTTGSQKFNQLSANAAFTLQTNTGCLVQKVTSTQWLVFLSA